MNIGLFYIAFTATLKIFFFYSFKKLNKMQFIYICSFILIMILALRSIHIDPPDLIGYVRAYESLRYETLSNCWSSVLTYSSKDPFFYFVAKLFNLVGFGYRLWLSVLSLFFIFSITRIIKEFSPEPFISYVALISLGFLFFSVFALRQALAMSFLLLSFLYLYRRRFIQYFILVIIGALFHSTALIFLLAYPIGHLKVGIRNIAVILISLAFAFFFPIHIRRSIYFFGWNEHLISYAEREMILSISGYIIQSSIFLFCLIFKDSVLKKNNKNIVFYNMLFLGVIFNALSLVVAEFFRVSYYFGVYSIVFIPLVISEIKSKETQKFMYFFVLASLIAYIFWSNAFGNFRFMF